MVLFNPEGSGLGTTPLDDAWRRLGSQRWRNGSLRSLVWTGFYRGSIGIPLGGVRVVVRNRGIITPSTLLRHSFTSRRQTSRWGARAVLGAYWRVYIVAAWNDHRRRNGVELLGVGRIVWRFVDSCRGMGDHELKRSICIPVVSAEFEKVFAGECIPDGE